MGNIKQVNIRNYTYYLFKKFNSSLPKIEKNIIKKY